MAIDCLVDQSYSNHPLGDRLDAVLHLPVYTSRSLLATYVCLVPDPAAIAGKWAVQLRYACIGRPAFDL